MSDDSHRAEELPNFERRQKQNGVEWAWVCVLPSHDSYRQESDEVITHEQVRHGASDHGSCDDIGRVVDASVEAN